jgi:error-prone DNA polymerase
VPVDHTCRRRAAKGEYRCLREDLLGLPDGLLCLWLDRQPAATDLELLRAGFNDRLWLAVELHHEHDDARRLQQLQAFGERHRLPLVASGDVHMHVRRRRACRTR